MKFPETYIKSEGSIPPVWMNSSGSVEVNLPGNDSAPDPAAVEFARNVWPLLPEAKSLAESIFSRFVRLDAQWHLDAIVVSTDATLATYQVQLQFSHPEDVYGLWTASFESRLQRLNLNAFERRES
jgi:hypothetical protein